MVLDRASLIAELAFLRKGRATRHTGLSKRLGPNTKLLCGIADDDDPQAARNKILLKVNDLLRNEPRDVQIAALAALGLHPGADHRLLRDRTKWLAQQLTVEERTARRRVEEAFATLVDIAADQRRPPGSCTDDPIRDGWYVKSFRAILRLDTSAPELIEQRKIVITKKGLREITCRLSLPRALGDDSATHDVQAEVMYGGRLRSQEQRTEEYFEFAVELPTAHAVGETHEYGIMFRLPAGQPMRPHYVFQPLAPCEAFDLTVRFGSAAKRPRSIWQLSGVAPRVIDSDVPIADILDVDSVGELRLTFRELTQGLAYGIKWAP